MHKNTGVHRINLATYKEAHRVCIPCIFVQDFSTQTYTSRYRAPSQIYTSVYYTVPC